jgi:hypothetical protein
VQLDKLLVAMAGCVVLDAQTAACSWMIAL